MNGKGFQIEFRGVLNKFLFHDNSPYITNSFGVLDFNDLNVFRNC